jgi:addiction module HigA family antidote
MTVQDFDEFETALPHPGEIIREEYMAPLKLSAGSLAKAMGLKDRTRIERLVRETGPITCDTALRLGIVFRTSPQYWMNLQTQHDLSVAAISSRDALAAVKALIGV